MKPWHFTVAIALLLWIAVIWYVVSRFRKGKK
jgi:hypothetical protein